MTGVREEDEGLRQEEAGSREELREGVQEDRDQREGRQEGDNRPRQGHTPRLRSHCWSLQGLEEGR